MKRLMADALLELVEEKPLSKITVKDIISRSGAGRQTFYNHFYDKNDLICWIFRCTLSGEKELVEKAGLFAYLTKLYSEARKYRNFLIQSCKFEGQNCLAEAIFTQTYNYYKQYILRNHGESAFTPELKYALEFNAHGAGSQYVRWVKAGMPGSPEEQARFALDCMPQCMKEYLPLGVTKYGCGSKSA